MPITSKTTLVSRKISSDGSIRIVYVISDQNGQMQRGALEQSLTLYPNMDADHVDALVTDASARLTSRGYPALSLGDLAIIRADIAREWTPAVIDAFKTKQDAAIAAANPPLLKDI